LSVAGLTLSVPAPGVPLALSVALALAPGFGPAPALLAATDDGAPVTSAVGRPAPVPPLAVGSTLACAVTPVLGVRSWPSRPRAGFARPLTPGVAAPAGGTPGCGGGAIQVTPTATAAAVPATAVAVGVTWIALPPHP